MGTVDISTPSTYTHSALTRITVMMLLLTCCSGPKSKPKSKQPLCMQEHQRQPHRVSTWVLVRLLLVGRGVDSSKLRAERVTGM